MRVSTTACFLAGIVEILATRLLQAPQNWFNDERLAPLFMFGHGIPPYPGSPSVGPMANLIYPPLSFLSYAPALLFHTPTAVVRCAALMAQFFCLAPCDRPHLERPRLVLARTVTWGIRFLLFAVFVAWAELSQVMTYIFIWFMPMRPPSSCRRWPASSHGARLFGTAIGEDTSWWLLAFAQGLRRGPSNWCCPSSPFRSCFFL